MKHKMPNEITTKDKKAQNPEAEQVVSGFGLGANALPTSSPGAARSPANVGRLKHAAEVMDSSYVGCVEITLRSRSASSRSYTAVTHDGPHPHTYTVRVCDRPDGYAGAGREFRCTCAGAHFGLTCKHIIKANIVDSEMADRELAYEFIGNYSAHRRSAGFKQRWHLAGHERMARSLGPQASLPAMNPTGENDANLSDVGPDRRR